MRKAVGSGTVVNPAGVREWHQQPQEAHLRSVFHALHDRVPQRATGHVRKRVAAGSFKASVR